MRDLVPFVQFKKREKHTWRSFNFSKVAGFSSPFVISYENIQQYNNQEYHRIITLYPVLYPGRQFSPRDSPRQLEIAEGFAEANSVFIVITLAKILPRWLFPSNIYIQFTIFTTYFSTKLSFTNKRYHLHVVEKCLYVLQEVRSTVDSSPFSSFTWQWNKLCFHVVYHRIGEILWRHIFKQLLFCFILLQFLHLQAPKKNKTCDMVKAIYINFSFEVSFF